MIWVKIDGWVFYGSSEGLAIGEKRKGSVKKAEFSQKTLEEWKRVTN